MPGKYKIKGKTLEELFATNSDALDNRLYFNLSQNGFGEGSVTTNIFINSDSENIVLKGWGSNSNNHDYRLNNQRLPFALKSSCPVPKPYPSTTNEFVPYEIEVLSTDTLYVRYNSSLGYCQYSEDGITYTKVGEGFDGVFVFLQGAGGGGGLGLAGWGVLQGAGGGGGGAFILAYLDLKQIPNEPIILKAGKEGSLPIDVIVGEGDGVNGWNGGPSTVSYNNQIYLSANGGEGGHGTTIDRNNIGTRDGKGGSGGEPKEYKTSTWSSAVRECCFKGCSGGNTGKILSWDAESDVGYGTYGNSYTQLDSIEIPILNTTQSILRGINLGRASSDWCQVSSCASGGGGGGASVCGTGAIRFNGSMDDPRNIPETGYGVGGTGCTSANINSNNRQRYPGTNGKPGCVGILKCDKI